MSQIKTKNSTQGNSGADRGIVALNHNLWWERGNYECDKCEKSAKELYYKKGKWLCSKCNFEKEV